MLQSTVSPNRKSCLSDQGLTFLPPNPSRRNGWNAKEVIDEESEEIPYLVEHCLLTSLVHIIGPNDGGSTFNCEVDNR